MTSVSNVVRFQERQDRPKRAPSRTAPPHGCDQFSLFEDDPEQESAKTTAIAILVPMQETHQSVFSALLEGERPPVLVDLRRYPTFALTGSTGEIVRNRISRSGARYLNCPLDLHDIDSKSAEWDLVAKVVVILKSLREMPGISGVPFVFLLHHRLQRTLFERSLMAAGDAAGTYWRVMDTLSPSSR